MILIEREGGSVEWESYMSIDPVRSADEFGEYGRMLAASKALRSYTTKKTLASEKNISETKRKKREGTYRSSAMRDGRWIGGAPSVRRHIDRKCPGVGSVNALPRGS